MTYTQAITDVTNGTVKYAWLVVWGGAYIYLFGSTIYKTSPEGPASEYVPTPSDQSSTAWLEGDRPPHP